MVEEHQRTSLFAGLGEDYDPFIDQLRKDKIVFFAENKSDLEVLKTVAGKLGKTLPKFTFYATTESHKDRRRFYAKLKSAIPGLKAFSIRDRDDKPIGDVCPTTLRDKKDSHKEADFYSRTWRRRAIENYAFVLDAIARAAGKNRKDLEAWWTGELGLSAALDPQKNDSPLNDMECKKPLQGKLKELGLSTSDTWNAMTVDEVHEDMKTLVSQMAEL